MRAAERVCRCLRCTATASNQAGVADCQGYRSAELGAALVSIRRLPSISSYWFIFSVIHFFYCLPSHILDWSLLRQGMADLELVAEGI